MSTLPEEFYIAVRETYDIHKLVSISSFFYQQYNHEKEAILRNISDRAIILATDDYATNLNVSILYFEHGKGDQVSKDLYSQVFNKIVHDPVLLEKWFNNISRVLDFQTQKKYRHAGPL